MTTDEMKNWIDKSSYTVLLTKWRFAPVGDPMFQGAMGDYYAEVMKRKGEEIGNNKKIQASKTLGWER